MLSVRDQSEAPGNKGKVTIKGENIKGIGTSGTNQFTPSKIPQFSLDREDVNFTPPIYTTRMSSPPIWEWPSTKPKVKVQIPFRVPEDTPTKEYSYSVSGWSESSGTEKHTEKPFTVTVQE